jgi:hypothetical protein
MIWRIGLPTLVPPDTTYAVLDALDQGRTDAADDGRRHNGEAGS